MAELTPRERISRYLVASAARDDSYLNLPHRPIVVRAADLEAILRECPEPACDGTAFDVDEPDDLSTPEGFRAAIDRRRPEARRRIARGEV